MSLNASRLKISMPVVETQTLPSRLAAFEGMLNGTAEHAEVLEHISPAVLFTAQRLIELDDQGIETNIALDGVPSDVLAELSLRLSALRIPHQQSAALLASLGEYVGGIGFDFAQKAGAKPLHLRLCVTDKEPNNLPDCEVYVLSLLDGSRRVGSDFSQMVMQSTIFGTKSSMTLPNDLHAHFQSGKKKWVMIYFGAHKVGDSKKIDHNIHLNAVGAGMDHGGVGGAIAAPTDAPAPSAISPIPADVVMKDAGGTPVAVANMPVITTPVAHNDNMVVESIAPTVMSTATNTVTTVPPSAPAAGVSEMVTSIPSVMAATPVATSTHSAPVATVSDAVVSTPSLNVSAPVAVAVVSPMVTPPSTLTAPMAVSAPAVSNITPITSVPLNSPTVSISPTPVSSVAPVVTIKSTFIEAVKSTEVAASTRTFIQQSPQQAPQQPQQTIIQPVAAQLVAQRLQPPTPVVDRAAPLAPTQQPLQQPIHTRAEQPAPVARAVPISASAPVSAPDLVKPVSHQAPQPTVPAPEKIQMPSGGGGHVPSPPQAPPEKMPHTPSPTDHRAPEVPKPEIVKEQPVLPNKPEHWTAMPDKKIHVPEIKTEFKKCCDGGDCNNCSKIGEVKNETREAIKSTVAIKDPSPFD